MTDAELKEAKKEIRSILITYQKGTSLSEFKREYRKMVGRYLPSQQFNFRDDVTFLKSMPDVVLMYNSPMPGDYHLIGVADESVKHIQNMVCKQKSSKQRVSYRAPRAPPVSYAPRQRSYAAPPRFFKKEIPAGLDKYVVRMLDNYPDGIRLNQFSETFCQYHRRYFTFKEWGFGTLEECLETIPNLNATTRNNEIFVHLSKYILPVERSRKPPGRSPLLPLPNKQEIFLLISDMYDNLMAGLNNLNSEDISSNDTIWKSTSSLDTTNSAPSTRLDYFDRDFRNHVSSVNKDKPLNLGASAESTSDKFLVDRCVEDSYQQSLNLHSNKKEPSLQPSFTKVNIDPKTSEQPILASNKSKADTLDTFQLVDLSCEPQSDIQISNDFNYQDLQDAARLASYRQIQIDLNSPTVSENIKNILRKVIEKSPHGIIAVEFPKSYEAVSKTAFDLYSLGFNTLADFIDAVPDIMIRKTIAGSKKDWVIYPAKVPEEIYADFGSGKCSALFVECVIMNTRSILQAYPEGVNLTEFIHLYSMNCNEPLYFKDLGFDSLENFLLSIAERVPLRIIPDRDRKVVLIDSFVQNTEAIIKPPVAPLQANILSDIVSSDAKFKELELPINFDYTTYVPVYTSSIANPGLLYIQLQGEKYSDAMKVIYDDMDAFYNGEQSNLYKMKPDDIKLDVPCIALWPYDRHWYRATIISVVSEEFVQVFYVDYATTDQIPVNMLRYMKKDYMKLPTQALKSRLAYLKPYKSNTWSKMGRKRMLELCQDVSLMAKIENIKNGFLTLLLCDTTGDDDRYINDILTAENIAEPCDDDFEPSSPAPPPEAVQQLISYLGNLSKVLQDASNASTANFAPPGFVSKQIPVPAVTPGIMPIIPDPANSLYASAFGAASSQFINSIHPPAYQFGVPIPCKDSQISQKKTMLGAFNDSNPSHNSDKNCPISSSPEESDVFDDDDDLFEKIYEEYLAGKSNVKRRCVKRVKTSDGYIFHVILFDSKPYAASGDISILIWNMKHPFQLLDRLPSKDVVLPSLTLVQEGNEEFFEQLERFNVKGIQKSAVNKASILMYPLHIVNQILNLFGHPSAALRAKINTEFSTFNPLSPHWQEFSDNEVIEEREDERSPTDDDKANEFNRLCLYDLKTMRDGIKLKRLKMIKGQSGLNITPGQEDEIHKLNQLFTKVRERIMEIEQICKMFESAK